MGNGDARDDGVAPEEPAISKPAQAKAKHQFKLSAALGGLLERGLACLAAVTKNCRSATLHCCCACLRHLSEGNCCPCWACDNGPYTSLCCCEGCCCFKTNCYCVCGRGLTEKEKGRRMRIQNSHLAAVRNQQRKDADQQDFFRGRGKYAKATELKSKGGGGGGSSPGGRGTSSTDPGAVDSRDVDWTPDHGFGSSYSGGDDTD
jgi:hypothetical protein